MEKYLAVIQAGGFGTRMETLTKKKIPKPMLNINGKPMIQWQIEALYEYGIEEIIIIVGYLGSQIKEYFQDGSSYGVHISYVEEEIPLGSAGALYYLKDNIKTKNFIFLFSDVMFKINWNRMIKFHEEKSALITVLSHPNSHPYDSDILLIDDESRVVGMDLKSNYRNYWYDNNVNAGIYIINTDILNEIHVIKRMDFEKDLLLPLISKRKLYAYKSSEYAKDAGIPERFNDVCNEQSNGLWERKCYEKKQKCIFLDRDGTINKYKGLIDNETDLEMEKYAIEAIKMINHSGYLGIVVTNQPVVARGMCDIEDIINIHRKMQTLLGREGAYVDDIVFCPHHPDKGYLGENLKYKGKCKCRKPEIGLIKKMEEKYNIDLVDSWMIGDSTVDIQTGKNAGMRTILIQTGIAGRDKKYKIQPNVIKENLYEAIKYILSMEKKID